MLMLLFLVGVGTWIELFVKCTLYDASQLLIQKGMCTVKGGSLLSDTGTGSNLAILTTFTYR